MNDMSNNTSKKWDKENMRTVSCRLRKDEAEAFKRLCASKGVTVHSALARYIRLAIHDLPIDRPEEEGQKLVNQNIALRQKIAYLTREVERWKEIAKSHDEIIDLWLRSADRKL